MAEGKELAMAIGVLTLSTREMYVYINESASYHHLILYQKGTE